MMGRPSVCRKVREQAAQHGDQGGGGWMAGGPTSLSTCHSEVATKVARSIAASGMSSTRKHRVPGLSITGHVVQSGCPQQSPATLRDSATQPRHSGAGSIAIAVCRLEFQGAAMFCHFKLLAAGC
jgi:hypothetical protein